MSSVFACRELLKALGPLIGAEMEQGNKAVQPGWADDTDEDTVSRWRALAVESVKEEMESVFESTFSIEYEAALRRRLALRRADGSDQARIFWPLLDMMERQALDFHGTLRKLASFRPGMLSEDGTPALEGFITGVLVGTPEPDRLDKKDATEQWLAWLERYAGRVEAERASGAWAEEEGDVDEARKKAAMAANPRFVLRQWVLEEVIARMEADPSTGKHVLAKAMQVSRSGLSVGLG